MVIGWQVYNGGSLIGIVFATDETGAVEQAYIVLRQYAATVFPRLHPLTTELIYNKTR